MKKQLEEIWTYFTLEKIKNDRRFVVFSVCLLIATGLWFLNALGKNYSTSLSYSIKYTQPPENLFLKSPPPSKYELKVEAHGFTLLRNKLALFSSPIVINLSSIRENSGENEKIITIQTQNLIGLFSEQISNEITITDINPKVMTLVFDSLASKRVPVRAHINTRFKPQFHLKGLITLDPESLKVSGPASVLDTIRFLKTEFTQFNEIDASIEKQLKITHPDNVRVSEETVKIRVPVEKFTEKEFKIPVQVKNQPAEAQIKLFPAEVQASFSVGLSEYENITPTDFEVFVDYSQADYNTETLDVKIGSKPPFIQMLRISPGSVEFLIETDK